LRSDGFSLIEVLFAIAAAASLTTLAIPATADALDEIRTASAARYIAGRIASLRTDAVRRSACQALRFEATSGGYVYAAYADGNINGVRTADIRDGIDPRVSAMERLQDKFRGVRFALGAGVADIDGSRTSGEDGVRIGSARILTMSPDGTATSGTLYIRGRRSQYAVRVLGVTGRTRVLQYRSGDGTWLTR
jgi:prepilin-type N-terminal cleavage/methylation domain-containing protein